MGTIIHYHTRTLYLPTVQFPYSATRYIPGVPFPINPGTQVRDTLSLVKIQKTTVEIRVFACVPPAGRACLLFGHGLP